MKIRSGEQIGEYIRSASLGALKRAPPRKQIYLKYSASFPLAMRLDQSFTFVCWNSGAISSGSKPLRPDLSLCDRVIRSCRKFPIPISSFLTSTFPPRRQLRCVYVETFSVCVGRIRRMRGVYIVHGEPIREPGNTIASVASAHHHSLFSWISPLTPPPPSPLFRTPYLPPYDALFPSSTLRPCCPKPYANPVYRTLQKLSFETEVFSIVDKFYIFYTEKNNILK